MLVHMELPEPLYGTKEEISSRLDLCGMSFYCKSVGIQEQSPGKFIVTLDIVIPDRVQSVPLERL